MIRQLAFAVLATATIGATAAPAQTVDFGGGGGPSSDLRARGQRERDYQREEVRRNRDYDRRGDRYTDRSGPGCRTVTVREQDDYGRTVTRTRRECS